MDEFTNKITTRQRPSIINNDKIIPSYGQLLHMVINQESSDDESFEDIDSEISYSEPSLRQVCEYLFDNKTLMTINLNLQEFPEYVNPGVLLKNIDHDMQAIDLKNYLTKKCGHFEIEIEVIRIFRVGTVKYAFVSFSNIEQCRYVYDYLKNGSSAPFLPIKSNVNNIQSINNSRTIRSHSSNSISNLSSPIINKNIIREYNEDVFYCYDLTDYKESLWYGVVLRNLDENCNKDRLKEFCQIITSGVLYTTTPEKVMNSICSIVVTYDLDDAEKICVFINNQKKKLKANIHPNSCKLRRFPEKSHFSSILAKNNEDNCTDQVDREDIMSIRKSIDNSSNTFILDDTIRSIYSADDLMIINNRKFSQLHQLVDVSRRNIPNEETPSYGNNCNTNYDHFQDNIIENRSSKLKYKSKKKIKDDQKTNSIITDKPTSPIRGTNSVENMVTKDLKFSNVFISPINDVNINNKKPSSSCDILNCKKRKRDVTTIQSTEAEINTHKSQTIHKEKEINSHSSYDKLDSLKINHEIPPSVISKPSNLVIKNIHLNSNRNIVNIYNPFKDTFNLGNFTKQNSNGKIIQSSYYSSLQKMPGDTKKPKFNSKSSKDI